ncbi:MAG: hypothetical protein RTU30_09065 [Candidatus Thorarchaeota archaeon]
MSNFSRFLRHAEYFIATMTMKEFILDGRNMLTVEGFYSEVERVLAPSMKRMGRNMHAFRDVLLGGFGSHDKGERIQIRIIYKKRMIKALSEGFVRNVFRILEEAESVEVLKGDMPQEETY